MKQFPFSNKLYLKRELIKEIQKDRASIFFFFRIEIYVDNKYKDYACVL